MTKNGYHTKRLSLAERGPRMSRWASEVGAIREDYAASKTGCPPIVEPSTVRPCNDSGGCTTMCLRFVISVLVSFALVSLLIVGRSIGERLVRLRP
jgi:hypothetical protein